MNVEGMFPLGRELQKSLKFPVLFPTAAVIKEEHGKSYLHSLILTIKIMRRVPHDLCFLGNLLIKAIYLIQWASQLAQVIRNPPAKRGDIGDAGSNEGWKSACIENKL